MKTLNIITFILSFFATIGFAIAENIYFEVFSAMMTIIYLIIIVSDKDE